VLVKGLSDYYALDNRLFTMYDYTMNKEEVIALRQQGLTFQEIGVMFGVTKQRAHQVFHLPAPKVYEGTWYSRMRRDPVRLEHYRKMKRENTRGRLCINGKSIKVRKRPRPDGICELCGREANKLDYHHWDDEHPEQGVWVCYKCHWLCECIDHGEDIIRLKQVYLNLKKGTSL